MPRDDDEEDRPRRKRRDEEEAEDRPRRRRRDDDDEDDEDDRPRRRRRDEEEDEDDYEPRRGERLSRATLRGIASNQKVLILCILAYLCLIPAQFAIPEQSKLYLALALVPLGLTATVFVFLLATKVYSTATGVVLGILTLIPCIGLIVLLIINGKATSILKENGVSVGLLGASSSDI
ncbi:hypothetical protein [Frigoriglobus tundricola]|uniref:Uncharacterized protein n=1 Tax=Frigoriglobus tundricola TaxID=2774151 RepID=A0A6M5YKD7_9BACT|nr:hypothetical protein [Frigoriglobus tundricola]QJW94539.1 hypothetical protein FTUN_2060 [Frigoriglobus tundricola]